MTTGVASSEATEGRAFLMTTPPTTRYPAPALCGLAIWLSVTVALLPAAQPLLPRGKQSARCQPTTWYLLKATSGSLTCHPMGAPEIPPQHPRVSFPWATVGSGGQDPAVFI